MRCILRLCWVMLLFRLTLLALLLLLLLLLIYGLYERILNSLTHCRINKPTFFIISLQLMINYRWFLRVKWIWSQMISRLNFLTTISFIDRVYITTTIMIWIMMTWWSTTSHRYSGSRILLRIFIYNCHIWVIHLHF